MSRLIDEYNNIPLNKFGKYIKIIIGSRLIDVGVDFNCTQNIIMFGKRSSINGSLQNNGRGARAMALINLPKDNQHVHIFNILATLPDRNTADVVKWKNMIEDKHRINYIEDILNSSSITAAIYKDVFPANVNIYTEPKMIRYNKVASTQVMREFLSPSIKEIIVSIDDMTSKTDNLFFSIDRTILANEFQLMLKLVKSFMINIGMVHKDNLWDIITNSDVNIGMNKKFLNRNMFVLVILYLASEVPIRKNGFIELMAASIRLTNTVQVSLVMEYMVNNPFSKFIVSENGAFKKLSILADGMLFIHPIKKGNSMLMDVPDVFEFGRSQRASGHIIPSRNIIKATPDSSDAFTEELYNDVNSISSYKDVYRLFDKYQTSSHVSIIERIIVKSIENENALKDGERVYIKLLSDLRYVFTYNELMTNKTIKLMMSNDLKPELSKKNGGYISCNTLKLYNPLRKEWDTINDKNLNVRKKLTPYKVVGSFSAADNNSHAAYFKLRQESKAEADKRKVKRGIVCYSKNKEAILTLIAGTEILEKVSGDMLLVNICNTIKEELFTMELKARKEDTNISYITILDCKN